MDGWVGGRWVSKGMGSWHDPARSKASPTPFPPIAYHHFSQPTPTILPPLSNSRRPRPALPHAAAGADALRMDQPAPRRDGLRVHGGGWVCVHVCGVDGVMKGSTHRHTHALSSISSLSFPSYLKTPSPTIGLPPRGRPGRRLRPRGPQRGGLRPAGLQRHGVRLRTDGVRLYESILSEGECVCMHKSYIYRGAHTRIRIHTHDTHTHAAPARPSP